MSTSDAHRSPAVDRPRQTMHLLTCDVVDELLVHHSATQTIVALNASARAVWELCTGARTVGEIAAALAEPLGLPPAALVDDVSRAVGELRALGIVEPGDAAEFVDEGDGRPRAGEAALLTRAADNGDGVAIRTLPGGAR